MDKLVSLADQYHKTLIDTASFKLRMAAAISELTEGDCAELAIALEGWEMAKDLN